MERAVPILPADDLASAPRDEHWSARTFSVHDPSGNTIFVIGPVHSGTPLHLTGERE